MIYRKRQRLSTCRELCDQKIIDLMSSIGTLICNTSHNFHIFWTMQFGTHRFSSVRRNLDNSRTTKIVINTEITRSSFQMFLHNCWLHLFYRGPNKHILIVEEYPFRNVACCCFSGIVPNLRKLLCWQNSILKFPTLAQVSRFYQRECGRLGWNRGAFTPQSHGLRTCAIVTWE